MGPAFGRPTLLAHLFDSFRGRLNASALRPTRKIGGACILDFEVVRVLSLASGEGTTVASQSVIRRDGDTQRRAVYALSLDKEAFLLDGHSSNFLHG
jgi:hypothetical protein